MRQNGNISIWKNGFIYSAELTTNKSNLKLCAVPLELQDIKQVLLYFSLSLNRQVIDYN